MLLKIGECSLIIAISKYHGLFVNEFDSKSSLFEKKLFGTDLVGQKN